MIRKWLAIESFYCFVGVTIAPTINFNSRESISKAEHHQRENQSERDVIPDHLLILPNNNRDSTNHPQIPDEHEGYSPTSDDTCL